MLPPNALDAKAYRRALQALAEELGDLLLQIVLHAQIAIDNGEFHMTDVMRQVNQKMVRRHPHVWSTSTVEDAEEVVLNWQATQYSPSWTSSPLFTS